MELELKHITNYLPYRLRFHAKDDNSQIYIVTAVKHLHSNLIITGEIIGDASIGNIRRLFKINEIVPILRPIEALVEPMVQDDINNGEPFMPIQFVLPIDYMDNLRYTCKLRDDYISIYMYDKEDDSLLFPITCKLSPGTTQQLSELYFDYWGLIKHNLATVMN